MASLKPKPSCFRRPSCKLCTKTVAAFDLPLLSFEPIPIFAWRQVLQKAGVRVRAWDLGFRVLTVGLRGIEGLGFRVQNFGFRLLGLGFKV